MHVECLIFFSASLLSYVFIIINRIIIEIQMKSYERLHIIVITTVVSAYINPTKKSVSLNQMFSSDIWGTSLLGFVERRLVDTSLLFIVDTDVSTSIQYVERPFQTMLAFVMSIDWRDVVLVLVRWFGFWCLLFHYALLSRISFWSVGVNGLRLIVLWR